MATPTDGSNPSGKAIAVDGGRADFVITTVQSARGEVVSAERLTVLVIGATGSIGRLVVAEAIRQGYTVRALVRNPSKAR